MTAWVYSVMRNERTILPWFLKHYRSFCDRIVIYDDQSDDGTQDIALKGGAEVRRYPYRGLDDTQFVQLANEQYKEARGYADWIIWVDADEFLYHPRMAERLAELHDLGITLPKTQGFNMVAEHPPTGDGQIYEEITTGFFHDRYSKPVILDPTLDIVWEVGKHAIHVTGGIPVQNSNDPFKLLHYRFLGRAYFEQRSARNWEQISERNKAARFGYETQPGWTGEYSADWYVRQPVGVVV